MIPEITSPADLFSFSHTRNMTRLDDKRIVALRSASSSPEGMRATVHEQVTRWGEQSDIISEHPEKKAGIGPHPRMGIGLPMSNIFAT